MDTNLDTKTDGALSSSGSAPFTSSEQPSTPEAAPAPNAQVLTEFVSTCAALFLLAEEGHNPAVTTYVDAVHYIATSLSVGYANIFPVTQMGKAIGALVMMVGPALSAKALEESRAPAPDAVQRDPEVVARLDAILTELRRQASAAGSDAR